MDQFKDVPHFASKIAIETALRQFEIPFTIIRPNYFIQNDLSLKAPLMGPGVYPMPLGTPGISVEDIRDITEPARLLCTCSPAGQDEFFLAVGIRVPSRTTPPPKPDVVAMAAFKEKAEALAPKYRTEILKKA